MNKKKLTLLIALSIIIIIGIFSNINNLKQKTIKQEPVITTLENISPSVIEEVETIQKDSDIIVLPNSKFPEAQLIWDTMISWGWTPETCAGIIGNMMAEVSGGTLDLSNWNSNGGCGYGLIQWTGGRRTAIKERYGEYPNIKQQLDFMKDELFGTNNTTKQVNNKVLDIIMNKDGTQTPESIAFTFASYYERCAQQYREMRKGYARIAYEYFMNK